MKAERPLNVVFFKTESGNEPVREWLKELSKEDCKVIGKTNWIWRRNVKNNIC